ncbi:lytic transglycosylase domain-containing protein [Rhizobium leguminosarum]
MLKTLLRALVLTPLLVWQSPAFSFDSNRFYSGDTQPVNGEKPGSHLGGQVQQDLFELSPSGRIDKISTINISNTSGLTEIENDLAEKSPSIGNIPPANLNTLYSSTSKVDGSASVCGPSPMTAAEIEELVERTAQSYGVDPGLAKAIAWVESRFDRNSNSQQGARGPMQLMPATASELGVKEICDPASNIDGGVRHLKLMLEEFKNPILAAAAYNAGAQAVYDNGGVPPFGETVRYVADVINHQMGLKKPRKAAARGIAADTITPSANEIASDVLGARGSRFIKGVMQF